MNHASASGVWIEDASTRPLPTAQGRDCCESRLISWPLEDGLKEALRIRQAGDAVPASLHSSAYLVGYVDHELRLQDRRAHGCWQ